MYNLILSCTIHVETTLPRNGEHVLPASCLLLCFTVSLKNIHRTCAYTIIYIDLCMFIYFKMACTTDNHIQKHFIFLLLHPKNNMYSICMEQPCLSVHLRTTTTIRNEIQVLSHHPKIHLIWLLVNAPRPVAKHTAPLGCSKWSLQHCYVPVGVELKGK